MARQLKTFREISMQHEKKYESYVRSIFRSLFFQITNNLDTIKDAIKHDQLSFRIMSDFFNSNSSISHFSPMDSPHRRIE